MRQNDSSVVSLANSPRGIATSPINCICRTGNFPEIPSIGVRVDWSHVRFASISQVAAITAIQLCGTAYGVTPVASITDSNVASYISRMNYFAMLGIDHVERFCRHEPNGRFVPLTAIPIDEGSADPNGVAGALREVIKSHVAMSESAMDLTDYAFGEIVDNVVQHSRASSPGIACAQYYKADSFLEICVADPGIGIVASMTDNEKYRGLEASEVMQMAFEAKTGQWCGRSKPGTRYMSGGIGLSVAAKLAKSVGGHVWAVSHDCSLHISKDGSETMTGLFYPGTLIVLRIPETQEEVLAGDIFEGEPMRPARWSASEGLWTDDENQNILW